MNVPRVPVARRPEVAILATGDELVMPGEAPRADQIVASNAFALTAMIEAEGAERPDAAHRARTPRRRSSAGFDAARGADLIVTIGGASVGDHDLVGAVAGEMGLERAFYKIAMRPGKPLMAGRRRGGGDARTAGKPGLVHCLRACSSSVPLLRAMLGLPARAGAAASGAAGRAAGANGPREHYMRAVLGSRRRSRRRGTRTARSSPSCRAANALIVRPVGDGPRAAGEVVDYLPLLSAKQLTQNGNRGRTSAERPVDDNPGASGGGNGQC